jgi:uncharacterized protein
MDYPTYDPKSADTPLSEDELSGLDELLAHLPADGAMTLDGMDGFLTALLVGPHRPETLASGDWLPLVWGGDGEPSPFASNQKRKKTSVLVLRHLRSLDAVLALAQAGAEAVWEPIFSVAESPEGEELADATDWCMGFLAATDLHPDAWAPLFADPELGPGLATIAWLGGDTEVGAELADHPDEDELEDPVVRDHLSRAAADVVLKLRARQARA